MAMLPFAIVYHKLCILQCIWNDERGFEQAAVGTYRMFKI